MSSLLCVYLISFSENILIDAFILFWLFFKGDQPLHLAAHEGHLPVINYLVSRGADVHATRMDGRTAVHCAAQQGCLMVVKHLVQEEHLDPKAKKRKEKQLLTWQRSRNTGLWSTTSSIGYIENIRFKKRNTLTLMTILWYLLKITSVCFNLSCI